MSGTALDNWKSNPEEDHGPLMSGCLWGLWALSTVFVGLRAHVRLRHARIWWDDAFLFLGWVRASFVPRVVEGRGKRRLICVSFEQLALLVQCILNQVAVSMGFGKHALDSMSCRVPHQFNIGS